MKTSRVHTGCRSFNVLALAVGLAIVALAPQANAEMIREFGGTNGKITVVDSQTLQWDWGQLTLSDGGGASGLTVDSFQLDLADFTENPGTVNVDDIVIAGFDDPAVTVTLETANEVLQTLTPFAGIGIGAITMDISNIVTAGGTPQKGGVDLDFDISQLVITFQGTVITAGTGGGTASPASPLASASMTAVPEPSTLVLALLAGLGLPVFWYRRRRA